MSTKAKARTAPVQPESEPPPENWHTPPATTEDCLQRIRALGQRLNGHIDFMCATGTMSSTSAEARQRAATAFYERLQALERVLGNIREELWLG
jgi:hypothetical protein